MLNNLKLMLNIKDNNDDELLKLLLSKAENYIKAYTQRSQLDDSLKTIAVDVAVVFYNRLGTEGENSRNVGVAQTFDSGFIPKHVTDQLKQHRLAKVCGVVYEK